VTTHINIRHGQSEHFDWPQQGGSGTGRGTEHGSGPAITAGTPDAPVL
jgi:hypothetical protein